MEKFYLEEANIERKEQVIEYVEEHFKYKAEIAGCSGLDEGYKNYEEWLLMMKELSSENTCPKDKCPGIQYFLIRQSDDKLIGMINLRWNLNEWMLKNGGHIGYGIRPTERRKGYNKINLYLCLLEAQKLGLEKVLLTASDKNPGSIKTIQALGGILENKITTYNDETTLIGRYWIDVNKSIKNYKDSYIKKIYKKGEKKL